MKARPVGQLVYECIFPKPRASDPPNFYTFVEQNLIAEVRSEVQAFYGHLDTPEAKYPGLDYCHPIHRVRLSRWPWHRRLFRAFDYLRLTPNEIANLTKWEGTRWAKERYEKEQGITIRDTASDDISDWVEPEDRPAATTNTSRRGRSAANVTSDDEEMSEEEEEEEGEEEGEEQEQEHDEGALQSVGAALNARLRERVARREAADTAAILDEEWEQWLKNAIESGEFPFTASQILQQSTQAAIFPQALVPPPMLDAARAGQWNEVPEFLHDILRRSLNLHRESDQDLPAASSASADMPPLTRAPRRSNNEHPSQTTITITTWRPTFSELRLPGRDSNVHPTSELRIHRTTPASGA